MKKLSYIFSFLILIFNSFFIFGCNNNSEPYTKVIILSGQSNMYGCSNVSYLTTQTLGEDRYNKLKNPINNVKILMEQGESETDFAPIQIGVGDLIPTYFGPELGLAEYISNKFNNENVYVIKFAVGGSSLYQDWISPSRNPENQISYNYKLLTELIDNGLEILTQANLNPKIVGFCWMQGEADGSIEDHSKNYFENLNTFVNDLREKYNSKSLSNNLNFIDAYISNFWEFQQNINNAKTKFSKLNKHNYVLNTLAPNLVKNGVDGLITNEEPYGDPDPLHYDSLSMLKLGEMFGEQIYKITK